MKSIWFRAYLCSGSILDFEILFILSPPFPFSSLKFMHFKATVIQLNSMLKRV